MKQRNGLFDGEILGIALTSFLVRSDYFTAKRTIVIIATSEAYYAVGLKDDVVKLFGNSNDDLLRLSPFELALRPFPSSLPQKPNKKPRLSCMMCSAKGLYVDRTTLSTVWCSHYCKLSQKMQK